jgi:hypothetical protein
MKFLAILTIAATAGTASARNTGFAQDSQVTVCVGSTARSNIPMVQAKGLASKMFAAAGVTIRWKGTNACPPDAIRVSLSEATPESDHPDSYGYAMPYESTHIVLFWDRIATSGHRCLPYLAAHVLVHEVTHILQGISRHSETGLMKATFTRKDIGQMECRYLPFTEEDVQMIHNGMKIRQERLGAVSGK